MILSFIGPMNLIFKYAMNVNLLSAILSPIEEQITNKCYFSEVET